MVFDIDGVAFEDDNAFLQINGVYSTSVEFYATSRGEDIDTRAFPDIACFWSTYPRIRNGNGR
eukprot:4564976-Lingulodinium_polyedra.AAC.1